MHGVSGFEDHLVSHAVVKRVFCELQQLRFGYPKRLAFFTYYNKGKSGGKFDLKSSKKEEIDCWVEASDEDYQKFIEALDCYETYQQVIEESNIKNEAGSSNFPGGFDQSPGQELE